VPARGCCVASGMLAPLVDAPHQRLRIAHRSPSTWQLAESSGRVVACIAAPGAVRFPLAFLVPTGLPAVAAPTVDVGAGELVVDGLRLDVTRWWSPPRPRLARFELAVDDIAAETMLRGWRDRLGTGGGLTPYADDVLCGALVTLLAIGHPAGTELASAVDVTDLETVTTATSAALLRAATSGRCIDQLAGYLEALAGDPDELRRRRSALEAVGHSSGRGMVEGVGRILRIDRGESRSAQETAA
jgi:Protein of unknown function (DUF2877)